MKPDSTLSARRYRFGIFEVDLKSGEVRKAGIRIRLQSQPFEVLAMLLTQPGEIVTREELQKKLWPTDIFVDFDHGVNTAINKLRDALSDSADTPRYIETLPRRGYRFIAPVESAALGETEIVKVSPDSIASVSEGTSGGSGSDSRWARIQLGRDPAGQEVTPPRIVTRQSDAKYLATISGAAILFLAVVGFAARAWRLHNRTFDLNDLQMVQITDTGKAVNVAISPDGRYVAYALQDGEKESLRLRQLATRSDLQILPLETGSFAGLTFSPDSNYIYFVRSDRDDPAFHSLYMMPALGGPQHQVMKDVDSAISFSPDARQFVFTRGAPQRNSVEVRTASSDGTGDKLLATLNDRVASYQFGPTWSPDGRTIALSATQWGKQLGASLVTVSLSDGSVRELYFSPDPIGRPVWSGEGDELLAPMNDRVNRNLSQLWAVSYPEGKADNLQKKLLITICESAQQLTQRWSRGSL